MSFVHAKEGTKLKHEDDDLRTKKIFLVHISRTSTALYRTQIIE